MSNANVYQQCFNDIGIITHENVHNIQCGLTNGSHNPSLGNHYLASYTNKYCKHSSEYRKLEQNTSLYPGNLANQICYSHTANQINFEQIETMRPQHKTHIWDKANNNVNTPITEVKMCTVNFTNRYWLDSDQGYCVYLVFILNEENIRKFYYWEYNKLDKIARLSDNTNEQVGYIEVMYSIALPIQFLGRYGWDFTPR